MIPWNVSAQSLAEEYGTDLQAGLSNERVREILKHSGRNSFQMEKRHGHLFLLLRQLKNPMVYTLAFAAVIAWFLGEMADALAIVIIVVLNSTMGYLQEAKAERSLEALQELSVPDARVIRGGKVRKITSEEVVPGDILYVEAGDYIAADARLIEVSDLQANESLLTGESLDVQKNLKEVEADTMPADRMNILYAGTAITRGSGKALVIATGDHTEMGKIAGLLNKGSAGKTPLEQRMEKLSHFLLGIGAIIMFLVSVIGLSKGHGVQEIFMNAIGLAVAAIPEGLPAVVTIALTLAVKRMAKRNAIVRHLPAIETLGTTHIICTDKTGTLTTGIMSVREVNTFGRSEEEFLRALVLCNNASIEHEESGDTTEVALLRFGKDKGFIPSELTSTYPRVREKNFDSERKMMSTIHRKGNSLVAYVKGAPESVIPLTRLTDPERITVLSSVHGLSQNGARLLAVAMRTLQELEHEPERDLEFLGIVALADPPKEGVRESIGSCRKAGLEVAMITGDHPSTALAIAAELGIATPGFDGVMTGKELEEASLEDLKKRVRETAVYARVNPHHKLRIVDALKADGMVVAMTGDGVNDAPALRTSSIGISMGKGGTEVARQASDIILTDDNFTTIVSAIEEGRGVHGNIRRTVQYLLSTNLAEVLIMLGGALFAAPVPVTPAGILFVNLVTDGAPSLALAAEPVRFGMLNTSVRPDAGTFMSRKFLTEIFLVAVLNTVVCLVPYFYFLHLGDVAGAKSVILNLLVFLSLFRALTCRSEDKTFVELPFNPWLSLAVFVPLVLQLFLQSTEIFQRLFHVRSLSRPELLSVLLLSMVPSLVIEVVKILRRWSALKRKSAR